MTIVSSLLATKCGTVKPQISETSSSSKILYAASSLVKSARRAKIFTAEPRDVKKTIPFTPPPTFFVTVSGAKYVLSTSLASISDDGNIDMTAFGGSSYSANVKIWLEQGLIRVPLSQVGPSFIVPSVPHNLEAGEVDIVVEIDGERIPRRVNLIGGLLKASCRATILSLDANAPF